MSGEGRLLIHFLTIFSSISNERSRILLSRLKEHRKCNALIESSYFLLFEQWSRGYLSPAIHDQWLGCLIKDVGIRRYVLYRLEQGAR